jgi:putative MATE family efflux protein
MSNNSLSEQNLVAQQQDQALNSLDEIKAHDFSSRDEVIIKGSTWAAIWHMSWPLFVNMITISVASFADIWVAGQLGSDAQAAIGLGGQIWFFFVLLAVALSSGTNALVSRFWGARDLENTIIAARQSLIFSVIFGIASAAIGLILCRPLLAFLGATPTVQAQGWEYLKYDLIAHIPFTVLWIANSIFRAKGNARVPMWTMILITALVIVLDLGLCIWPLQIGVAGIGMSWGLASIFGLAVSFYVLSRSEIGRCLDIKEAIRQRGMSREWFVRLMRVGWPACLQDLSWVGGNFVLFLIFALTAYPTACQASWAVGLRVEEMFGGMPIYALSMAVATIVGQNLGANQPARAERAGWQVTAVGGAINAVVGLSLFFGADAIAHLMSTDPLVIQYSREYLQVVGLSEPFVAIWLILFGAMQGAGYTKWPSLATFVSLVLFRLPLAYVLTVILKQGPIGTWCAIALSSLLVGTIMIVQYRSGKWKHQQV